MKPKAIGMSLLVLMVSLAAPGAEPEKHLPSVFIIGDSISLGYTDAVRQELRGVAEVSRPKANCAFSQNGLAHLKAWLGDGKWDVIHFNFGIWDTHLMDAKGGMVLREYKIDGRTDLHQRSSPQQYRENLTRLVEQLQATGAKVIWASTTQIASRKGKRLEAIPELNKVAAEVMQAHNVPIDDLYGFTLPHLKEWQTPDQCHFNAQGNQQLGKQVARSIREALGVKPDDGAARN